ncbi:hypothetical protein H1R20_g2635, partial [Candolleomyces eurysporus]
MTALANGTYFISSIIGGGDRFYLGFSSGATREPLVINSFTGSESHQWDVEPSNIPNVYTFRNRRYETYISVNPPSTKSSWCRRSSRSQKLTHPSGNAVLDFFFFLFFFINLDTIPDV